LIADFPKSGIVSFQRMDGYATLTAERKENINGPTAKSGPLGAEKERYKFCNRGNDASDQNRENGLGNGQESPFRRFCRGRWRLIGSACRQKHEGG
jgi:hypothetical protein